MSKSAISKKKIRVGVLRGGPSHEYDISLRTGATVLEHLKEPYEPFDIFISKDGEWHIGGRQKTPERILSQVDVVWNGLHGAYGEDGKVQNILETFGTPYTGSRALASSLAFNKNLTKALFGYHGLRTPEHTVLYPHQNTLLSLVETFRSFPQPAVVKPLSGGSSIAVSYVRNFPEFKAAIERVFKYDSAVLVEEYIHGTEVTCGVVEGSDGETIFALYPVAPERKGNFVFDYGMKYTDDIAHECPASLSAEHKDTIQKLALDVHKKLGLRHYSAIDVIVHPTRGIYLLEVNTLPGLTSGSLFPKALSAAQVSVGDFLDHVLSLALRT